MMKLAKSIATVSTALTFAFCLAGGVRAQSNTPAHKPVPQNANAKPAPAPLKSAPPANKPATAANPKPVAAKPPAMNPVAAKAAALKPAGPKSSAAKTVAVKPTPGKPIATKPVAVKSAAAKTTPEKPAAAAVAKTEKPTAVTPKTEETPAAPPADTLVAKRDPFVALVNDHKDGGGPVLPPGKAGLVVATVRVDGTVKSGEELIAVVSNPEKHVYFIREGDQLYDGNVKRIDLDGVTFQENSKDAFGKPVEREVMKRIYASAGEQQ